MKVLKSLYYLHTFPNTQKKKIKLRAQFVLIFAENKVLKSKGGL